MNRWFQIGGTARPAGLVAGSGGWADVPAEYVAEKEIAWQPCVTSR
jgi:hypothetical protein